MTKQIADERASAHSPIVHAQQNAEQDRDDCESHRRPRSNGPECPQINDQEVGIRCTSSEPAQHHHPANLQSGELSKPNAAVNISSARPAELRCYFSIAGDNHAHQCPGQQHSPGAEPAHFVRNLRRQPKDPASQNRIHSQRNQAPAPDCPNQPFASRVCLLGLGHRAFVSQRPTPGTRTG